MPELYNVDVQNMESMFIENDPTFAVTSSQQSAETRHAWKIHQHEKIMCFIDAEKREITTNSAAVLSTPMARNIVNLDRRPMHTRVQWNLKHRDKTSNVQCMKA